MVVGTLLMTLAYLHQELTSMCCLMFVTIHRQRVIVAAIHPVTPVKERRPFPVCGGYMRSLMIYWILVYLFFVKESVIKLYIQSFLAELVKV